MKQVHTVAPDKVNEVWDEVSPLLNVAFLNHDDVDYGIEYLKKELVSGKQHLFLVVEDEKIIGAYTMELIDYDNHRVALTTCMGGKKVFNKKVLYKKSVIYTYRGRTSREKYWFTICVHESSLSDDHHSSNNDIFIFAYAKTRPASARTPISSISPNS